MVATSSNETESPPSQTKALVEGAVIVDSKDKRTQFEPSISNYGNSPSASPSSNTNTTAQETDILKVSLASSIMEENDHNNDRLDSSGEWVEEEIVENVQPSHVGGSNINSDQPNNVTKQNDYNNKTMPEESYHLVTPAKMDSVSTLGNVTYLQDSSASMEEATVVDEFYSTRNIILEEEDNVDNDDYDGSRGDKETRSIGSSSPNKPSSSRSAIRVRTVDEDDGAESQTTVSTDDDDLTLMELGEKEASIKQSTNAKDEDLPDKPIEPTEMAESSLQSTSNNQTTQGLGESFVWDLRPDSTGEYEKKEDFETSVDWGDSSHCSYEVMPLGGDDDTNFGYEDIKRSSSRSLFSQDDNNRVDSSRHGHSDYVTFWGRQNELDFLQQSFKDISNGTGDKTKNIIWISAISPGVGKTHLVSEFLRRLPKDSAIVCRGSCSEEVLLTPYQGLASCFSDMLNTLLNNDSIGEWRTRIRDGLGDDIFIVSSILPILAVLLDVDGPSNQTKETEKEDSDIFQSVKRGIGRLLSLACSSRMIVFFIDNLQWMDGDSLRLLESLAMSPPSRFMFIGCHRRIRISHSLSRMKAKVASVHTHDIRLPDLESSSIQGLLSYHMGKLKRRNSSLNFPSSLSEMLSSLARGKNSGNAFYSIQLLRFAYEKEFIRSEEGQLILDTDFERPSTIDQLISSRLSMLSQDELLVVQSAALLGTPTFDCNLVALSVSVLQSTGGTLMLTKEQIESLIWTLEDKLLFKECSEDSYGFESNSIRSGALSMLSSDPTNLSHYHSAIATKLLNFSFEDTQEDYHEIDEAKDALIAYHIGKGLPHIGNSNDASLIHIPYLVADRLMAKGCTAAALEVLTISKDMTKESTRWKNEYKTSLKIYSALSRCHYLCGNLDEARSIAILIKSNSRAPRDKLDSFRLLSMIHRSKSQFDVAKTVILKALEEIWSEDLASLQVEEKLPELRTHLNGKSETDLLILDVIKHRKTKAKLPFLMDLAQVSGFCQDFKLQDLAAMRMVELTLRYGSYGQSFTGLVFALYGVCLGRRRIYGEAYRYGQLAEMMSDTDSCLGRTALTYHHYLLRFWKGSARESPEILLSISKKAMTNNDDGFISMHLCAYLSTLLVAGESLSFEESVVDEYRNRDRQESISDSWSVFLILKLILKLKGKDIGHLQDVRLTNTKAVQYDLFYRMVFAVFFDDMETAATLITQISIRPNGVFVPFGAFFEGLSSAYLIRWSVGQEKIVHQKKASKLLELLTVWSKNGVPNAPCLANFLRISITVANEIQVAPQKAAILFDAAIESALGTPCIAALSSERAALYFISIDDQEMASKFMSRSYRLYEAWGAMAKLKQLKTKYSTYLRVETGASTPRENQSNVLHSSSNHSKGSVTEGSLRQKSMGIVTNHDHSSNLIDLSQSLPPQSPRGMVARKTGNSVPDGSGSHKSSDGDTMAGGNRRSLFQRVASERVVNPTMPPNDMRQAFLRRSSDRGLIVSRQDDETRSVSLPHYQPVSFTNHPQNLFVHPQAARPPLQNHGYGYQQQGQPWQQQVLYGNPSHPMYAAQIIGQQNTLPPHQYMYMSQQHPHAYVHPQFHQMPPILAHTRQNPHTSVPPSFKAGIPSVQSMTAPNLIDSVSDHTTQTSTSDSSSPRRAKSSSHETGNGQGRSKSLPRRSKDRNRANSASKSPRKQRRRTSIGSTFAELREDLHPKSFLQDLNFGRNKNKEPNPQKKEPIEGNAGPTSSKKPTKERPSRISSWLPRRKPKTDQDDKPSSDSKLLGKKKGSRNSDTDEAGVMLTPGRKPKVKKIDQSSNEISKTPSKHPSSLPKKVTPKMIRGSAESEAPLSPKKVKKKRKSGSKEATLPTAADIDVENPVSPRTASVIGKIALPLTDVGVTFDVPLSPKKKATKPDTPIDDLKTPSKKKKGKAKKPLTVEASERLNQVKEANLDSNESAPTLSTVSPKQKKKPTIPTVPEILEGSASASPKNKKATKSKLSVDGGCETQKDEDPPVPTSPKKKKKKGKSPMRSDTNENKINSSTFEKEEVSSRTSKVSQEEEKKVSKKNDVKSSKTKKEENDAVDGTKKLESKSPKKAKKTSA